MSGPGDAHTVGPGDVLMAALAAALGGWLIARLLERHGARPLSWWSFIGSTALALSIVGPSWLADGSRAVALIALDVVTAVVVITGFARTLPACSGSRKTRWVLPWASC